MANITSGILKVVLPLLVIAGAVEVFMYFKSTAKPPQPIKTQSYAVTVSAISVNKVTAAPTLRVFGQVESSATSVLTSGVTADVLEVRALEGERIRRGQRLVILDSRDNELEIAQREAEVVEALAQIESAKVKQQSDRNLVQIEEESLRIAQRDIKRYEQLAASNSISLSRLDEVRQSEQRQRLSLATRQQAIDEYPSRLKQLQARHARAKALLQSARRARARTVVQAPFDGRVTEVFVSRGDRATTGMRLLRVYDEAFLELRAQMPSIHLSEVRRALDAGQPIRAVTLDNGKPIGLYLHRLAAQVGESQGGVDAFFRAQSGKLPVPGETMEINVELTPLRDVVVLPADALYGRDRVYVIANGSLQARNVRRLGQTSRGRQRMLIVSGADFKLGEQVLSSRLPQAANGLSVRVVK